MVIEDRLFTVAAGMAGHKIDYASLDVGFEFPPAKFVITQDWYKAYLQAVGEDIELCRDTALVSPLSALALAMAEMSKSASMPEGSIHVSQTFEFQRALRLNDTIIATATVTHRLRSRKVNLLTVGLRLSDQNGKQIAYAETEFILGYSHGN